MKLSVRLILLFALVGLSAVGVNALLSNRVAGLQVRRFFQEQDALAQGVGGQGIGGQERGGRGAGDPFALAPGRQQLLENLRRANLQAGLFALAVALAVGSYVAFRFTRPITAVTRMARRYGAGERSVRVPADGADELAELARVFNHTADLLQVEQAQQQRLITDVAHELRTPLTVLKSELEAMEDGLMEATPEALRLLKGQVELLDRLVNDLRFLTVSDAGEMELVPGPTDLAALAREATETFRSQAEAQGVTLTVRAEPIVVQADADRLRQALLNLLGNALRHSPQAGTVLIEVDDEPPHAVIRVADEGPGIAPEHLPYLFDRFFRVDAARSRELGGSGLGLAIVKAIVELHGGEVLAMNRSIGGACFEIRLPRRGDVTSGPL